MTDTIICYDIAHPRRLGRVFRFLKKCATPLQYSVFLFTGDDRQLDRCLAQAAQLIDPREDDLRAYPLPKRGFKARLGKAALPEGIQWSGLPVAW
jgi:CRISPR-associated endonuclease Cas2